MGLIFQWKGNGLAPGAFTTSSAGTGDTAPSQVSLNSATATIITTGGRTPGIQMQETTTNSSGWIDWNVTPTTTAALRFYYTPSGVITPNHTIFSIRDQAETRIADFNLNDTGTIRVFDLNNANQLIAPSGTIVVNNTYRFEIIIDTVASVLTMAIYSGDNTTPLVSVNNIAGNFSAASVGCIRLGKTTTTQQAETQLWDDIVLTSDQVFVGPAVIAATVSAGPDRDQIEPFSEVSINGTALTGSIATWAWSQLSGPAVTLFGSGSSRTFTAPAVSSSSVLQFQVVGDGLATDTVSITVNPHLDWLKKASGLSAIHSNLS